MNKSHPKLMELSRKEQEDFLQRVNNNLSASDAELVKGVIEFNEWLEFTLKEKNMSINKLQKIIFGNNENRGKDKKKTGKKSESNNNEAIDKEESTTNITEENNSNSNSGSAPDVESDTDTDTNAKAYSANRGRLNHNAYTGACTIKIKANYNPGDKCPEESCEGRLKVASPGIVIKIVGQSFAKANKYILETLRCNLCEKYIKAELPSDVSDEKYDLRFKAQLCVYKHFLGVPNYRLEAYQSFMGVPLPDSTQFDKIEEVCNCLYPIFNLMEKYAANGHLIHGDDTTVKIQSLIQANKKIINNECRGMFTTGILSFFEKYKIYLFYSGRNNCGKNMLKLLSNRGPDLPAIKYMCDALPSNMPSTLKAIIINCLVHAKRNFTDIDKFFPEKCNAAVDVINAIYKHDQEAKDKNFNDEERLLHHQNNSAKLMEDLLLNLQRQLDERLVECNSHLGKAYKYMIKHWVNLTQFLRIPGAPLDNNIIERALKIPIRVRKNSLFYGTEYGAYIGDLIQSIICTSVAAGENPIDYLVALQKYKTEVFATPKDWMPWNYKNTVYKKEQLIYIAA